MVDKFFGWLQLVGSILYKLSYNVFQNALSYTWCFFFDEQNVLGMVADGLEKIKK